MARNESGTGRPGVYPGMRGSDLSCDAPRPKGKLTRKYLNRDSQDKSGHRSNREIE